MKNTILLILVMALASIALTPSAPITLSNCDGRVIQGMSFTKGTNGVAIKISNCKNVVIEGNEFELDSGTIAIQLDNSSNIQIRKNRFHNFKTGVYAIKTTGGIQIQCNQFYDIAGRKPRGQMVQFNTGTGGGNQVNYNLLDHTFGSGYPEDLVNMYASSGTVNDPIQIIGNQLRGGGPSTSGGGIMVGDNGGQNIRIEDNILVNPGQYGIGSPAGKNIVIQNNKIYSIQQTFTNVGLYVGLKSEIDAGFACDGASIHVKNNQVNWKRKDGVQNDFYFYTGCGAIDKSGNVGKAAFTESVLPDVLTLNPQFCPQALSSSTAVSSSSSSMNHVVSTLQNHRSTMIMPSRLKGYNVMGAKENRKTP